MTLADINHTTISTDNNDDQTEKPYLIRYDVSCHHYSYIM